MRSFASEKPDRQRFVVPVFDVFPKAPQHGEICYLTFAGREGLYIYLKYQWERVQVPTTLDIECFVAQELQQTFMLAHPYSLGINALQVFVNGRKIPSTDVVEIDTTTFTLKRPCELDDQVEVMVRSPQAINF